MIAGSSELQQQLDTFSWYHSIDVTPGVATRGMFDLRHALDRIPFPDVTGKRCLDIGTWDGFYAFELERRGAAEVVAVDVPDLTALDYPPAVMADPTFDRAHTGLQPRNAAFHALHAALESKVKFVPGNIYELDPAELGTFDVVVVGSLLVHLRDPVRALDSVRKVTRGHLLSIDYVHTPLVLLSRRRPLFELKGETSDFQWWLASDAGLRHLLRVSGFEVERSSKPFLLRRGAVLPAGRPRTVADTGRWLANWALTGDSSVGGHLHRAHVARAMF